MFHILASMIILIFVLSGVKKLLNININAIELHSKISLGIPLYFYKIFIVIIALFEIIGPILIIFSSGSENYEVADHVTILLIIFTILATVLYHFPPFKKEYNEFMKNLSLIGALLLLSYIFKMKGNLHLKSIF